MSLDKSINNLSQRLNKLSSETSSNINYNDGIRYWQGKKIIPIDQWFQIKKEYNLKAALQFFPDNHPNYGLRYILDNIEDTRLKEYASKWYSDYKGLMEHRRNPVYGRAKCFRCLLSPDREQAAIFFGINKVIAKALERIYGTSLSIYPCSVLNIFECPYAIKKENKEIYEKEDETPTRLDILFELSEIAFQLELALTKAQVMTKSNDTIYEANFENGKVRQLGYFSDRYDLYAEGRLEEVKRSEVPIRSHDDIYHVLTDRESLDKVLEQGLDEEHQMHKDDIVKFFMSIKEGIRKEDLFNAQNSNASCSDDNRTY